MAKRHNHYRGKGRPQGRGRSRNMKKSSRRGGQGSGGRVQGQNNWHNSGLPMGDGDLSSPFSSDLHDGRRSKVSPDTVTDYYFSRSTNNKSMKMGGLRPGQKTPSNNDLNSNGSTFRKRPMEFIRAKEVYDPSHDLIEELRKKNEPSWEEQSEITTENNEPTVEPEQESSLIGSKESDAGKEIAALNDEDIFYVDVTGTQHVGIKTEQIDESYVESSLNEDPKVAVKFNSSITIGKTELRTVKEQQGGSSIPVRSNQPSHPFYQSILERMRRIKPSSDEEFEESLSESADDLSAEPYEESVPDTLDFSSRSPCLENNLQSLKLTESQTLPEDVSVKEEIAEEEIAEEEIAEEEIAEEESADVAEVNIVVADSEPEYGFLDEDYLVDLSDIHVTNMRLGLSDNSYYVKCFRLFADHEPRWVSQELFDDFILEELGFPEHRLSAYLKFIKASIMPSENSSEPTYSDIPLSDDTEDEDDLPSRDGSVSQDMREGLDDLIAYTEKYSIARNQKYESSPLQTTGKGKKKKLLVDDSLALDLESIATLQDKLDSRTRSKANKRRTKEDFIDLQNKTSHDLLKKYPSGMHVHNIKDEFESFLTSNRERVSFPPLDPHGSKTITKFAQHYNLKSSKIGNGNHIQVVAQKTRKTKRSFPNYNLIDQLLKQRPIFMRIDVSHAREASINLDKPKGKFHAIEGEVIGKGAPEIGRDNVGRRILEKLGWINGEGLGAYGNKGISEPLMATVKKSKSGLRHSNKG